MILGRILKTWRPEVFQGQGKRHNYFEGWYYKIVDQSEKNIWAVIPGVSFGDDPKLAHAFVQTINGATRETEYHRFGIEQFHYAEDRLELNIGGNRFTRNGIRLELGESVAGELRFDQVTPWPGKLLRPGIMGWYAFVPGMECYHGVVSLNHRLQGRLRIGGIERDFSSGLGYIEKDWGRSFPSSWIWLQSNHFEQPDSCLTLSIARIPWLGRHFTGLIAGLWVGHRLYVFATYTGAAIEKLAVDEHKVVLSIADRRYRLEVEALRSGGGELRSPTQGTMQGRIVESVTAIVQCVLYEKSRSSEKPLFVGTGRNAGLEVTGDMAELFPQHSPDEEQCQSPKLKGQVKPKAPNLKP